MDRMMGCLTAWKCFVACLFFDESQQPTWPHSRHMRRCTQRSPSFRHSSQPFGVRGTTLWIWLRCVQDGMAAPPALEKGDAPSGQCGALFSSDGQQVDLLNGWRR